MSTCTKLRWHFFCTASLQICIKEGKFQAPHCRIKNSRYISSTTHNGSKWYINDLHLLRLNRTFFQTGVFCWCSALSIVAAFSCFQEEKVTAFMFSNWDAVPRNLRIISGLLEWFKTKDSTGITSPSCGQYFALANRMCYALVPPYPWWLCSKDPNGCLKPQITQNPIFTMFFLMHAYLRYILIYKLGIARV